MTAPQPRDYRESYELVSLGGRIVHGFDRLEAAQAKARALASVGTKVRIERVRVVREAVAA